MFAACTYRHPHATLRYADYCLLSTQHRYTDAVHVQKQMYKVHRPDLQLGYRAVSSMPRPRMQTASRIGCLHYTPGPKARAEYAAFQRRAGTDAATLMLPAEADQDALVATQIRTIPEVTPLPGPETRRPPVATLGHQVVAHPPPVLLRSMTSPVPPSWPPLCRPKPRPW